MSRTNGRFLIAGGTLLIAGGTLLIVLLGAGAIMILNSKAQHQRTKNFPIAGTLYQWPDGTTIIPPQPPGVYGKGYVRYRSSRLYPDRNAFLLIYDANHQEARNKVGLPPLQMITSDFGKLEQYSSTRTPIGTVVCNRKGAQVGLAFACGLSFVHRGARWQLEFAAEQVRNAESHYREAVRRLEAFREGAKS